MVWATGRWTGKNQSGAWDVTSWAILDDSLTPPVVHPMPYRLLCFPGAAVFPADPRGAQVADMGVVDLPVTTPLLQGQGCAPRRNHLGQGGCHSQGGGIPLPATLSCLGRPLEQREGGDPQRSPPLHMRRVLVIPPILARLGVRRPKDEIIAQLLTVSQREPLPWSRGEPQVSRGPQAQESKRA